MKKHHKLLLVLAVSFLTLVGMPALSSAQRGNSGGCHDDVMQKLSPEVRESIRKAHEALAPVFVQYWAKQAELSAKIYSGADDKTIQDLAKAVENLHSQLLEGRIGLQKQMAKAGLPMREFHGGMKGGFHGGMMGGGMMGGMGDMGCPGMGGHGRHGGQGDQGDQDDHGDHMGGGAKPPAKGQK